MNSLWDLTQVGYAELLRGQFKLLDCRHTMMPRWLVGGKRNPVALYCICDYAGRAACFCRKFSEGFEKFLRAMTVDLDYTEAERLPFRAEGIHADRFFSEVTLLNTIAIDDDH